MKHWSHINPELNSLFHRLWTKAVGTSDYSKDEWLRFEKLLEQMNKEDPPCPQCGASGVSISGCNCDL